MSKRGRTGQLVVVESKVLHVDELAELGGDRPCQRTWKVFQQVVDSYTKQGKMSKRGRTV